MTVSNAAQPIDAIAPKPRLDVFHDGGDRLLARAAVEAFLNRGLERLVFGARLPISANQIPDVLAVGRVRPARRDPESDPWLTLRKLEKRWENDESYREMRNVAAFHLDEDLINRGLDDLTKDPCVPLANGQGSKHVKSRLTLGFLALHNGLGLDLDGYRRFHETVMADLAVVPEAIQNAFIDAAKAVGVPFGRG